MKTNKCRQVETKRGREGWRLCRAPAMGGVGQPKHNKKNTNCGGLRIESKVGLL